MTRMPSLPRARPAASSARLAFSRFLLVQDARAGQRCVLPALLRLGEARRVCRWRVSAHRLGHDPRAIEGHADGLADLPIVEWLLSRVEVKEDGRSEVRVPVLVARGVLRHPASLDVGKEERRPVELAPSEGAHDLVVAAVERDPQHPHRRFAGLPVFRVLSQLVDRRLEPPHLGEGARAHGVGIVERLGLGHVLPLVLGHDRLLADIGEARGVGPLEGELDGRGVDRGHARQELPRALGVQCGEALHEREREGDVLRGERRAV